MWDKKTKAAGESCGGGRTEDARDRGEKEKKRRGGRWKTDKRRVASG